jgi:hypothetical protein
MNRAQFAVLCWIQRVCEVADVLFVHVRRRRWENAVGLVTATRTGRSGVRCQAGARDISLLHKPPDHLRGPPSSFFYWAPKLKCTTYLHIEPRLRTGGALSHFPPYVFMAGTRTTLLLQVGVGCYFLGGGGLALYCLFPDDTRCYHLDSALMGCDAVLIGKVTVESDDTLFLRYLVTRRHAPEDLNVQQHRCEHL